MPKLNPKKKIFEKALNYLKTNNNYECVFGDYLMYAEDTKIKSKIKNGFIS